MAREKLEQLSGCRVGGALFGLCGLREQRRFTDIDRVKQELACGLVAQFGLKVEMSDNLATYCPEVVEMASDRLG